DVRHIVADAIRHNVLRANHRTIDADFLGFRLPATDHSHFYWRSGSALHESVALPDGHVARADPADGFQNFATAHGGLSGWAVRNDRDNHDVAVSLRYSHSDLAVHGILRSVAIVGI